MVGPLSWLINNNQLKQVCGTLTKCTLSKMGNQDKRSILNLTHPLTLPHGTGWDKHQGRNRNIFSRGTKHFSSFFPGVILAFRL